MKRHAWARAVFLLAAAATLAGCIWVPYDERGRGREREGGYYEHDDHRGGEHHEGHRGE